MHLMCAITPTHTADKQAFSLVELSIVLVILGLLVGGVLSGQSLIRASELRSVTTQQQQFVSAILSFRDRYLGLPGDITNATQFWGAAAVGVACITTESSGTGTCDGNGDGIIATAATSSERHRAWQQLANANLISGKYRGFGYSLTTPDCGRGSIIACPEGKYKGSSWHIHPATASSSGVGWASLWRLFRKTSTNSALIYSAISTPDVAPQAFGVITPEQAWNIDSKMDDGKPATGKVVVATAAVLSDCTDTASPTTLTASYLLTSTQVACSLVFHNPF